jgi:acyl-CoA reductase-like NAD-dependent aldehyde dehydrogenase
MGMPINLSKADVDDSMHYFSWYLDNAEKYLSPEVISEDEKTKLTIFREPIGLSANITPWNFTTSNFVWSAAQSLISGNVVVYKTSEEVTLSGKLIEEIMNESDLPVGVFSEVYGNGEVGKILVNCDIDVICFTGSTNTGKYLYKVAASKFIKVFLELGGSALGIIFEDVNIDRVIDSFFGNRFMYCGQVCDGLKRLIVHKDVADDVVKKLVEKINNTRVGDPLDEKTEIGPLVSEKQLNTLMAQVEDAREKGAKKVVGGERLNINGGYFYKPTVLTNVSKNMKVWTEEVFGPVLPVVTFKTDEDGVIDFIFPHLCQIAEMHLTTLRKFRETVKVYQGKLWFNHYLDDFSVPVFFSDKKIGRYCNGRQSALQFELMISGIIDFVKSSEKARGKLVALESAFKTKLDEIIVYKESSEEIKIDLT